jgi:hypothetical protein
MFVCCTHGLIPMLCDKHKAPESSPPCPQCARFREKLDREKMAKVITLSGEDWHRGSSDVNRDEHIARSIIAYLTE